MVILYCCSFIQLLSVSKSKLQRTQSFQGVHDYSVYHEENPLAGILTNVYGVRIYIVHDLTS